MNRTLALSGIFPADNVKGDGNPAYTQAELENILDNVNSTQLSV